MSVGKDQFSVSETRQRNVYIYSLEIWCVYVCVFVCVCVCDYNVKMCIRAYMRTCVCVCMCMRTYMHACARVCMCVSVRARACVRVCM
jgi:hypothetical protein